MAFTECQSNQRPIDERHFTFSKSVRDLFRMEGLCEYMDFLQNKRIFAKVVRDFFGKKN